MARAYAKGDGDRSAKGDGDRSAKGDGDRSAKDAVESYVGAYIDFLGSDRNFVRLIQREALGDGSRVAEFFGRPVDEAVAALRPAAEKAGISPSASPSTLQRSAGIRSRTSTRSCRRSG